MSLLYSVTIQIHFHHSWFKLALQVGRSNDSDFPYSIACLGSGTAEDEQEEGQDRKHRAQSSKSQVHPASDWEE
jgi:hypothetical protein